MEKLILILLLFFGMNKASQLLGQELITYADTSEYYEEDLHPIKIVNPKSRYAEKLEMVQKLYPYALYAADVLHDLDAELLGIEKKRLVKKTSRTAQKELFDKFNYMIKDLYHHEGVLLMKLIYRETGMTVDEIIRKYRNKAQASIYTGLAKLFDQDLKVKYYPEKGDRLVERVIQDIKNEEVYFDPTYKEVTKQDYKAGMKIYRENKKKNTIAFRKLKKENKLKKKEQKKTEKAKNK